MTPLTEFLILASELRRSRALNASSEPLAPGPAPPVILAGLEILDSVPNDEEPLSQPFIAPGATNGRSTPSELPPSDSANDEEPVLDHIVSPPLVNITNDASSPRGSTASSANLTPRLQRKHLADLSLSTTAPPSPTIPRPKPKPAYRAAIEARALAEALAAEAQAAKETEATAAKAATEAQATAEAVRAAEAAADAAKAKANSAAAKVIANAEAAKIIADVTAAAKVIADADAAEIIANAATAKVVTDAINEEEDTAATVPGSMHPSRHRKKTELGEQNARAIALQAERLAGRREKAAQRKATSKNKK